MFILYFIGCVRNTYYYIIIIIMAIAHCVRRDFPRHDYHRSNSWLCIKNCLTIYLFVYTFNALSWTTDIVDFHWFIGVNLTKIILLFQISLVIITTYLQLIINILLYKILCRTFHGPNTWCLTNLIY